MSDPEVFELELWGGATERRWRAARPDIESMPWGSLADAGLPADVVAEARMQWTLAAFQEHRTGAQCTATLRALFECKAPVDLTAIFARFPVDEMAHVELAARMAMALGGAVELTHTVEDLVIDPSPSLPPLLRAAELVVRTFCVGEALSIPLLHAAWQDARYPLARAVLGRIVRDEAAHGVVGWTFLDWAAPFLDDADRAHLSAVAAHAVGELRKLWRPIAARGSLPSNGLGWIGDAPYLSLAKRSLEERVRRPLAERGISL